MGFEQQQKEQQKQKTINAEKNVQTSLYSTDFKQQDGVGAPEGPASFARLSSIPQAAGEKNGGVFRFFKKSSLTARNAPGDPDGTQQQQPVKVQAQTQAQTTKTTTAKKAKKKSLVPPTSIDLTTEEREGETVKAMRERKAFLVEKADADLTAQRAVPLTDFTRNLIEKVKLLGQTDASKFGRYADKFRVQAEENDTAKECIPFLIQYLKDSEKMEQSKDPAVAAAYAQKYGHISDSEKMLLRTYAEFFAVYEGKLQVTGKKQIVADDSKVGVPQGVKFEKKSDVPLFNHMPNIYDMKQGGIGNCYLISSLITLVHNSPDIILNCMKDNGDTVTVRFYREGEPVFVTVDKSIPYSIDKKGNKVGYGSWGALWVNIMEKAYAVFAKGKNMQNLSSGGATGASDFITHLTRRAASSITLAGDITNNTAEQFLPKEHTMSSLLTDMRKKRRAEFEADLAKKGQLPQSKKQRNLLWNREKAKIFFGLKDEQITPEVVEAFRKNTAFESYINYFKQKMRNFSASGLRTKTEFAMLISTVRKNDLPPLGIPGLTPEQEKAAQDHYMQKVISYMATNPTLFSINNDYEYREGEENLYEVIKDAHKNDMYVTTGTSRLRFQKQVNGQSEGAQEGIYGNHAYAVLGTKEQEITVGKEKKKRKFVIVANPWQRSARMYNENTGVGFEQGVINDAGKTVYDNHGVFMVELRDFYNTYSSVEFQ